MTRRKKQSSPRRELAEVVRPPADQLKKLQQEQLLPQKLRLLQLMVEEMPLVLLLAVAAEGDSGSLEAELGQHVNWEAVRKLKLLQAGTCPTPRLGQ